MKVSCLKNIWIWSRTLYLVPVWRVPPPVPVLLDPEFVDGEDEIGQRRRNTIQPIPFQVLGNGARPLGVAVSPVVVATGACQAPVGDTQRQPAHHEQPPPADHLQHQVPAEKAATTTAPSANESSSDFIKYNFRFRGREKFRANPYPHNCWW